MRSERENSLTPEGNRGTIWVIEHDSLGRAAMRAWLVDAGYEVHVVPDGEQCLEELNAIGSDLVLLGLERSDTTGLQACRRLAEHVAARRIPLVCLTESTADDTLQSILDAGGCDFVRKPVGRVELLTRVNAVLDQSRAMQVLKEKTQLQDVLAAVGVACHELNQPLQYVLGIVQLLMMDFSPGDDMYEQLDGVRARIEDMGGITRNLTDLTRFRNGKMPPSGIGPPADTLRVYKDRS